MVVSLARLSNELRMGSEQDDRSWVEVMCAPQSTEELNLHGNVSGYVEAC